LKIPHHVAVIMDGKGRWAQQRGLPRFEGHRRGALKAERFVQWASEMGIKYVTLYAFSTENWRRPENEVNFLFSLLRSFLRKKLDKMVKNGVRLRFCGELSQLPNQVKELCYECEQRTSDNTKITVITALNYGGRHEIVRALQNIVNKGAPITEESVRQNLYLPDVPDPDLVIRTSGEVRISNFLLWQIAYSELCFISKMWPDFSKRDFKKAIEDYGKRTRRFGGV